MTRPARRVRVAVPAKVNLHLSIGDLHEDGYHDVVTVFHAIDLGESVTVRVADGLRVSTGATRGVPTGATNLAARAATLLAGHLGRAADVAIHLDKRIPVAGGLAGGSADAAGALVGCAALWEPGLPRDELLPLAAQLGADVPFVLVGGTAIGTGRGEHLAPVLGRGRLHWALGIADGGLSTPVVYAELDRLRAAGAGPRLGAPDALLSALAAGDAAAVGARLGNDLQAAAISLRPALRQTLRAGRDAGALGAIVSGSGPTVALLAADEAHAAELAAELAGSGTCRSVRTAAGPAPGARVTQIER